MINLTKGQKIDLTKGTTLTHVNVGLGWDAVRGWSGPDIDCDASCVCLDENNKVISQKFQESTVYFSNTVLPGIRHSGDNRTGAGEGDDETIEISLEQIPERVNKLVVFMNIYEASKKGQDMAGLQNAYIRLYNPKNHNEEICRFNLDESKGASTGLIAGELYRHNGEWKFAAIGEGVKNADYVSDIVRRYF